jgi:hypothetical protein
METFATTGPVEAHVQIGTGDLRVVVSDRADATVDVRPTDPSDPEDRRTADLTRVHHAHGHVVVKGPRARAWRGRRGGSIDVVVELPVGSGLHGTAGVADITCDGPLGDARIRSGAGDVTVERASGSLAVTAGSGDVRVGDVAGSVVVKAAHGDTWIGSVGGALRAKAADGQIFVDHAPSTTVTTSARGDVRLGAVTTGTAVLETASGDVEVGIPEGTAALLDVSAVGGRLQNELEPSGDPGSDAPQVQIRARTARGDVTVRRA